MNASELEPTNEEQLMEAVADLLSVEGFTAFAEDTGAGTLCVVVEREDGGQISWGTAGENWGASVADEDGEYVSGIETDCRSNTTDVATIVSALKKPSIINGARCNPA